jgi:hypothetical protein
MSNIIKTYYALSVPMDSDDQYCQKFVGYFDTVAEAEAKAVALGVASFEVDEESDYEGDGEFTVIA